MPSDPFWESYMIGVSLKGWLTSKAGRLLALIHTSTAALGLLSGREDLVSSCMVQLSCSGAKSHPFLQLVQ